MKARMTRNGNIKVVMTVEQAKAFYDAFASNTVSDFRNMGATDPVAADQAADDLFLALCELDVVSGD